MLLGGATVYHNPLNFREPALIWGHSKRRPYRIPKLPPSILGPYGPHTGSPPRWDPTLATPKPRMLAMEEPLELGPQQTSYKQRESREEEPGATQ